MRERAAATAASSTSARARTVAGACSLRAAPETPSPPALEVTDDASVLLVDDQELMRMALPHGDRQPSRTSRSSARPPTAREAVEATRTARAGRRADGRAHARARRRRGDAADRRLGSRARASSSSRRSTSTSTSTPRCARARAASCSRTRQPADLLSAIRAVASGDAVVAPSVTRRLLDTFAHRLPARRDDPRRRPAGEPSGWSC